MYSLGAEQRVVLGSRALIYTVFPLVFLYKHQLFCWGMFVKICITIIMYSPIRIFWLKEKSAP